MRARPLSFNTVSVSRQIGFVSIYIYNAKAFFLPLENKGKDILSPEGRFYFSVFFVN